LKNRIKQITSDFSLFESWEDKYEHLIEFGQELLGADNKSIRIDSNLIHGCQSKVWLFCKVKNKKLYFYADSDALITKGLVAIIVFVYSGASATEIIKEKTDVFLSIGLRKKLSMNRSNGLNMMLEKVNDCALNCLKNEK